MQESSDLKAEIERRKQELFDAEWFLEVLLSVNEDSSQWGSTEAAQERLRQDRLADEEIRRKLDAINFSDRAHRRLDYLLSVAFSTIGIFNRKRALALCLEMERGEADSGPFEPVN